MPVRYITTDRVTPAAFDYAFYPSDLYYGDVAKDDGSFDAWNAQRRGFHGQYFGEVRGEKNKHDPINYDQIHYRCQVAVGRWPVSNCEAIENGRRQVDEIRNRHPRRHAMPGLQRVCAASTCKVSRTTARGWIASPVGLTGGWKAEEFFYAGPESAISNGHARSARDSRRCSIAARRSRRTSATAASRDWAAPQDRRKVGPVFGVQRIKQLNNADRLAGDSFRSAAARPISPRSAPMRRIPTPAGVEHQGTTTAKFSRPAASARAHQKRRIQDSLGKALLDSGPERRGRVHRLQHRRPRLRDDAARRFHGGPRPRPPCGSAIAGCTRSRITTTTSIWPRLRPNDDWYPPTIFFQGMKYMVYGDPSLPLE